MDVWIPAHARLQAAERGVTEEEIVETVLHGRRVPGHSGRLGAERVVPYNQRWGRRGNIYAQKRIVVYFVEGVDSAVVVTVITQFGQWEG